MKANCYVLLLRPITASAELGQQLDQLGVSFSHLPVMKISALDSSSCQAQLNTLNPIDKAIFISANAVNYAFEGLSSAILKGVQQVFAVGEQTSTALAGKGVKAISPQLQTTEGLLMLPELANVAGENIVIFAGAGGRELLQQQLIQRGASLTICELYQREIELAHKSEINQLIQQCGNLVVMVHSAELLSNLLKIVAPDLRDKLKDMAIIVPSERVAMQARQQGLKNIRVAQSALPKSMVSALHEWYS